MRALFFAQALGCVTLLVLAGCDLVQPTDDAPSGPPASLTGTWVTGPIDIAIDTSFAVEGDPTYASVEVDALFHVQTTLSLTDTGGDVRGQYRDPLSADIELRYTRHDGVVVQSETTNDRVGGTAGNLEAIYIAPTMTVTSEYVANDEFDGLTLDFSNGSAVFGRRLELPVTLSRLGGRRFTLVRSAATTLRRADAT